MELPESTANENWIYYPNENMFEVVDFATGRITRRVYPDIIGEANIWRGLKVFGSYTITTIFNDFTPGDTAEIPVNDATAQRRNSRAFTFTSLRVKNITTGTPFNLTSITINGVEIMSGPLVITNNVDYFDVPLIESSYEVLNNSRWLAVDDSFVAVEMLVQAG